MLLPIIAVSDRTNPTAAAYTKRPSLQSSYKFAVLFDGNEIPPTAYQTKARLKDKPEIFDYIDGDEIPFEKEPLSNLVRDHELVGYVHHGYWQCMDTLREKQQIEKLWNSNQAPWKLWED